MYRNNINLTLSIILIMVTLFSLLTIYASSTAHSRARFGVSAKAAVLYEAESDRFLYSKNPCERLPMASTTKIMTAIVALEASSLDEVVTVDERACLVEGSRAYFSPDEEHTMEELLYALLLQSANDAAEAIAYHIAGGISEFSEMMNEKARELGLSDTNFENPHGLDSSEHYTTAEELAKIAAYALSNEAFRKIASTYKIRFTKDDKTRLYVNHNKLLTLYDGCVGVKTGFTKKSGRCLVSAAERDGLTFIGVTLDAPDDWRDHTAMLDFGFDTLMKLSFVKEGEKCFELPVIDGVKETLKVTNKLGASKIIEKGEYNVEEHIKLSRYAVAPIHRCDVLGEIIYTVDGEECARVPLIAAEDVNKVEKKKPFRLLDIFFKKDSSDN